MLGQGWVCARGGRHAFSRLLYAPRPAEEGGRKGEAAGSIEQESRGGERGREVFLLTKMGFNPIPAENEFLSSPRVFLRALSPDFPAGWVFFSGGGRRRRSSQVTPLNRPERRKEEGKKSIFFLRISTSNSGRSEATPPHREKEKVSAPPPSAVDVSPTRDQ